MIKKPWAGCMCRCLVCNLSTVTCVLALGGVALWFTAADLRLPGFPTLVAIGLFVASVAAGVALVCAIFCAIEKMTGPLYP